MFGELSVNTNYSSKTKVHGVQYRFQSRINMKLMKVIVLIENQKIIIIFTIQDTRYCIIWSIFTKLPYYRLKVVRKT